jgi:hypothetical protein
LVYLIKATIYCVPAYSGVSQIALKEIVRFGLAEARKLQVGATDPEALLLQPPDEVAADKSTGTANQGAFHSCSRAHCKVPLWAAIRRLPRGCSRRGSEILQSLPAAFNIICGNPEVRRGHAFGTEAVNVGALAADIKHRTLRIDACMHL